MNRLVPCRDSGATSPTGGNMGGHRHSVNAYATCPTCGKSVKVTRNGRLWAHGTRPAPKPVLTACDLCGTPSIGYWPTPLGPAWRCQAHHDQDYEGGYRRTMFTYIGTPRV